MDYVEKNINWNSAQCKLTSQFASTNLKIKMTSCLVRLPFFLCAESNFSESYEHFIVLNRKRLNPK